MKKQFKQLSAATLALTMSLGVTSGAFACTATYVGKNVSADGTTIIARSEDISPSDYNKLHYVVPASDQPGQVLVDDINGFTYPLPDNTYKYTTMQDHTAAGDGLYAAVCVNDQGVAVTATVSASGCAAWKEVDPTVETGLREAVLPALVAATSATAKEGVKTLLATVDEYGSEAGNIILIADQTEAWIVELYGGHQYAAQKLDPDMVAVFGNQFMIGAVDSQDTDTFILSKDLLSTLDKAGLTVKDEDGNVLLAQSVCGKERSDGSNMRTWIGHVLLAPSSVEDYKTEVFYPLQYAPDEKVTLQQVMAIYQNRYEGTPYDLTLEGQEGNRAIAVSTTPDTHIVQIYDELPKQSAAVTWLAMGGGEHAPFLPEFSGITVIDPAYAVEGETYTEDSAYWAFKKVCGLADVNRALYSKGVQDFWALEQDTLITKTAAQVETVKALYTEDSAAAEQFVNDTAAATLQDAMAKSDALYQELLTTVIHNSGVTGSRKPIVFAPSVPLRTAAEAKGYTVSWDAAQPDTVILTLGSTVKTVTLGQDGAYAFNGFAYVPAAFAEEL